MHGSQQGVHEPDGAKVNLPSAGAEERAVDPIRLPEYSAMHEERLERQDLGANVLNQSVDVFQRVTRPCEVTRLVASLLMKQKIAGELLRAMVELSGSFIDAVILSTCRL